MMLLIVPLLLLPWPVSTRSSPSEIGYDAADRFVRIRNFIDDYYPSRIPLGGKTTIVIADNSAADDASFSSDSSEPPADSDAYRRWTSPAPLVNKTLLLPVTQTTVIFDSNVNGRNSTLVTTKAIFNATKEVRILTSNATKELVIAWISPKRSSNRTTEYASDTYSFWRNAGALTLGVKRIRDENLLPNYNITLIHANGGCDPINTIRKASELMLTGVDVFLGPSCSGAAVPLNYFIEANRIPHILHGAGDPELSNRQLHPHAVRSVQNFFDSGVCLRDYFVSVMNWDQLAVVYQANYYQCDFFLQGILQKEPAALLARRASAGENQDQSGRTTVNSTSTNNNNTAGGARSPNRQHRLSIVGIHEASPAMSDADIDQILTLIRDSTRVVATCFSPQMPAALIRFMMRAKQRNMVLADGYVWLSFTTATEDPTVPPYLHRGAAGLPRKPIEQALQQMNLSSTMRPDDVISAFSSLIEISWQVDLSTSFRLNVMTELTQHPMWNWTRAQLDKEEPEPRTKIGGLFSPHLADSVYLFARAVAHADQVDGNMPPSTFDVGGQRRRNSTQMYEIMKSTDFWGESGYFALDDKGERLPSFTVRALSVKQSVSLSGTPSPPIIVFEKKGVISCNRPSTAAEVLRAEKSEAVPSTTKILEIHINETVPGTNFTDINQTTTFTSETVTTTTIVTDNKHNKHLIANFSATPGVLPLDWKTLDGLPPPAIPVCGFRNELCVLMNPTQTTAVLLAALLAAGVLSVICISVALTLWIRNLKRISVAQKSGIWRLEPSAEDLAALYKEGFGSAVFAREHQQTDSKGKSRTGRQLESVTEDGEALPASNGRKGSDDSRISIRSGSSNADKDARDEEEEESTATVGTELNDPIRAGSLQTSKLGYVLSTNSLINGSTVGYNGLLVDVYALCILTSSRHNNNSHLSRDVGSHVIGSASLSHTAIEQLRAMKQIQHDNINPFVGACFECDVPFFALLHCAKGTLADVLVNTDVDIDALFKMSFLNDVLNGLFFLHHAPTIRVYGRLRDENVVIDSRWTAKLTCYGFLECHGSVAALGKSAKGVIVAFDHPRHWLDCERYDKLLWTAPEILRACGDLTKFDIKQLQLADIYSFAVIMSEVLYKQRPYQHMHERAKILIEKLVSPQFDLSYNALRPLHTPFPVWQTSVAPNQQRSAQLQKPSSVTMVTNFSSQTQQRTHESASSLSTSSNSAAAIATSERDTLLAFENLRKLMIRAWHETPQERPAVNELMRLFKLVAAFRGASFMDLLVKKMESYASNLELIVRSRTAELVEETKRADMLLREILPESVVQQLKAGKSVEPEFFNSTTIFFSDIVQFTRIAGNLNPLQVVSLLNNFCVFMDDIIARYRVYKVETIGDGYLVVSGLPVRCRDHAAQIARMALHMISCIGRVELPPKTTTMTTRRGSTPSMVLLRKRSGDDVSSIDQVPVEPPTNCIRLRIGINSGPCVAGVVGLKMPRYCLFGDAVNVASRMESHGEPMRVHISETTKLELDRFGNEFLIEERGEVFVKGKGNMVTYWLLSNDVAFPCSDIKVNS